MITKSAEGRELVAMLAKAITSAIAPEEAEDFEELAEDYFRWSKRSDRTLGAGLDLFPDLVFVLFFISQVLSVLVKGILELSGARATARRRRELIHALAVHMEMLSGDAASPSRLSGELRSSA